MSNPYAHRYSPIPDEAEQEKLLSASAALYLELLRKSLSNTIFDAEPNPEEDYAPRYVAAFARHYVQGRAVSMLPLARLENLQFCILDAIAREVPGDLIETGVWRGGATILMCGVLKALGITDRTIWVADSFKGLPAPDAAREATRSANAAARASEAFQRGMLTLDRLRNGGRQNVVVQHVNVGNGAQAVVAGAMNGVGGLQMMSKGPEEPIHWRAGLAAADAAPRCGAKRKINGQYCRAPAMANGRCHKHGGASTGPRTAEGLERCRAAPWKHGGRSADVRAAARERGEVRRLITAVLTTGQ